MLDVDAETLRKICIESCKDTYDYLEDMQFVDGEISRAQTNVNRFERHGEYVILYTNTKIRDTGTLGLSISNKSFFDPSDVVFDQFDEVSRTVALYPSNEVMDLLLKSKSDNLEIHIIVDLK